MLQNFSEWLDQNFMRVGTLRNVARLFFIIGCLHFVYFFFFSGWIWNMHEKGNYSMWNSMALLMKHPYKDFLPGDWLHPNNSWLPYCKKAYGEMYCLATKTRWFSIALLMILPFILPFVHHYFVYQDEKSREEAKLNSKPISYRSSTKPASDSKKKEIKSTDTFKTSSVTDEDGSTKVNQKITKLSEDLTSVGFKVVKKSKDEE